MSSTNPLTAATISVANLDSAVAGYRDWLDHEVVAQEPVGEDFARSIGAEGLIGHRCAILQPESRRPVYLRLIESPPPPGYRPMVTLGWSAIELCVEDVRFIYERLRGGPFDVIGPPAAIATLPTIHPMQVQAPDGEVIFLTQTIDFTAGNGLPRARSPIDSLFIGVLACRDFDASCAWVRDQLGATIDPPVDIPYRTINRAFGLSPDRLHRLATARRDGHIFLEIDQYPPQSEARPREAGGLVPGISVVTIGHPNLDEVAGPWFSAPRPREGLIYGGARVGVLQSPEGAFLELFERQR